MVVTMMLTMFYFLYLTRRNPDLQRIALKPRQGHKRTQSNMPHAKTMVFLSHDFFNTCSYDYLVSIHTNSINCMKNWKVLKL